MAALFYVWIVVQLLVGFNLFFPLLLYFIYLVKSKKESAVMKTPEVEADYAIIVTAYEQINTLPAVADSLLRINYHNYLIYIVADKCDVSNLQFNNEHIILLRPEQTLASNTRSHFYAIQHFKRPHERLTIIDSDNLVDGEYINQLNVYFDKGYEAVQGLRKAKNLNTTYACLDAARDIYYHFYDGKILFASGASATLSGSGMAFTTRLYRECLESRDITGAGFDKVLQYEIVKRGLRIAYTEKAIVYDEKTAYTEQLVKQRARWINTWFRYSKFGFGLIAKGIVRFNRNKFLFGLVLLRPPLFIFLLLSLIFMLIDWRTESVTASIFWLVGIFLFVMGFLFALFHSKTDRRIYFSLFHIPKFVFFQVMSLLKTGRANQYSVATKHYHNKKKEDV